MGLKLENGVLGILIFPNFYHPVITEDSSGAYSVLPAGRGPCLSSSDPCGVQK